MKKTLLFSFVLLVSFCINAQIPNGGFENWTTVSNDWHLSQFRQDGGEKYQPAQHGNYAIKLTTESASNTSMITSSIEPDVIKKGGFPYSQKPTRFYFYAKYSVKSGDAASVCLIFKKNGVVVSGAYTNNLFKITGTNTSSYQKFDFAISGLSVVPDTVIIAVSSADITNDIGGSGGVTPQGGTYIIIDNMSFDTSNPIPYGDFEEWGRPTLQANGYVMEQAISSYVDYPNVNFPIEKSTDSHSGSFSLKVKTWQDPDWDNNLRYSGGSGDINSGNLTKFPCTTKDGVFRAWYKYIPASTDTARIWITFFKSGIIVGGIDKSLYAKSYYSSISIPFNCSETPDSASITFSTSASNALKNVGSTLYLDDLSLEPDVDWHIYDANLTPDNDGWSKTAVITPTVPIANPSVSSIVAINGANKYLSCVSDSTHANGYEYGSELISNTPMTVMLRAKSSVQSGPKLGGYFEIDFGPSYQNAVLKFKWNTSGSTPLRYVSISNATASGTVKVNYDSWHVYRITFDGDSLRLYVDEAVVPVIRAKPYLASPAKTSTYALKIVGSSISNFASGDVDWISWNYKGAFAPGQGILPSSYITTEIETKKENSSTISIYPNPANNIIRLSGNIQKAKIAIADINSRTVLVQELSVGEDLNISTLQRGIYIVKIETENGISQAKLIKK